MVKTQRSTSQQSVRRTATIYLMPTLQRRTATNVLIRIMRSRGKCRAGDLYIVRVKSFSLTDVKVDFVVA